MDEKGKPSLEVAKEEKTKAGNIWGNHNLFYRYENNGYGIAGRNCKIEITIFTDMPFSEIIQELAKASDAVSADLSQRNTAE